MRRNPVRSRKRIAARPVGCSPSSLAARSVSPNSLISARLSLRSRGRAASLRTPLARFVSICPKPAACSKIEWRVEIVAGVLALGLNTRVAALVMQNDRWDAGAALMQAGNPDGWRGVIDAANLVRANRDALSACREAAARTKTEQRYTITVPVK
ncbi:MAG: hypothetical protein JWM91_443 [Rhodospirillales bacterium]|nr:hypothetical protein [Rhodospirillales bacterium]